eukprot:CAMPEP_0119148006 /NCGR_PEP_ID=MMETSP1310-20130426/41206_1 /TAXON_ID=464262 /ORGANISM="Genus nov. species nov., Strain RCC2339" /LENGTH=134 /DNA_ID=CAMNT_0007140009 /DNA_START=123 /DNA_END=524 /DNA_ORIENTATION=-
MTQRDFMDLFWKLPSVEVEKRQTAFCQLLQHLLNEQKRFESESPLDTTKFQVWEESLSTTDGQPNQPNPFVASDVNYAQKRLINGVVSSNECARQGFGAALTEMMARIPAVSGTHVLRMLLHVTASGSGEDRQE